MTAAIRLNPSFSTRGVCNAGRRSRTTSWSKGLYHRSDVLVLIQKLYNETTNRFGWGNTAKAQKVETSIQVRIAHPVRLNFVNIEINVLLSSQKLVTLKRRALA